MLSSLKSLRNAFKAACFDPRKPGQMTTIVASNDPNYLIERAQEVLREAKSFKGIEQWAKVRDATAILGYAMTLIPSTSEHIPGVCQDGDRCGH